jgi:hypothetical protein
MRMSADYVNIETLVPTTTPEFPIGTLGSDDGGKTVFEYAKLNVDADTVVAGHLACGLDSSFPFGEVTNDNNAAFANRNDPRGFFQAVVAALGYGWVQCWGRNRQVIITPNTVTQFQVLYAHATTTGGVDSAADPANAAQVILGTALEADGDTVATQLDAGQVNITIRR